MLFRKEILEGIRAVAIEFRSKEEWGWWRQMWDVAFSIGSIVGAFLIGVAMGNIVIGVPLDERHEFVGTFLGLLNSYSLFLGVTTVFLFAMHGSIYLAMKNEGATQAMVRGWIKPLIGIFLACFILLNIITLVYVPHIYQIVQQRPILIFVVAVTVLLVLNVPREFNAGREFLAFLSSCGAMVGCRVVTSGK
jgi:cytochrome d ubiquinol oxidase subunit II